jgi:integrase
MVDLPANVARKTTEVWSADEVRHFLEHVSAHRLSLAFQLPATTGMRRGELLGLRWGDVDWDRGAVSERLGHSSVATTMDFYAHVIPAISRAGADIVANTLLGPRP